MIQYKDFVPEVVPQGLFKRPLYQPLEETLAEVNRWISQHSYQIINIETVVLPNMHNPKEDGSGDTSLTTREGWDATWHQFVRVWFKDS